MASSPKKDSTITLNPIETVNSYLKETDWRVNENSNESYSFSGLLLHAAGKVISLHTLYNHYPEKIRDAHISGSLHIHDLSNGIIGYCA